MNVVKNGEEERNKVDKESFSYRIAPVPEKEIASAATLLYQRLEEINNAVQKPLYPATEAETIALLSDISILLGAYCDGELIGVVAIEEDAVERIAVDKEWIRLGVGTALMQAAEAKGASYIDLYRENKGAVQFIEALGYGIYDITEPEAGDLLAKDPASLLHFKK